MLKSRICFWCLLTLYVAALIYGHWLLFNDLDGEDVWWILVIGYAAWAYVGYLLRSRNLITALAGWHRGVVITIASSAGVLVGIGALTTLAEMVDQVASSVWEQLLIFVEIGAFFGMLVLLMRLTAKRLRFVALTRVFLLTLAASALLLVIAIPCHIVASGRGGWFAGIGTFIGIVASSIVIAWSLGFGFMLWFRYPQYRAASSTLCRYCDYDLRGVDHVVCPECGKPVPVRNPMKNVDEKESD